MSFDTSMNRIRLSPATRLILRNRLNSRRQRRVARLEVQNRNNEIVNFLNTIVTPQNWNDTLIPFELGTSNHVYGLENMFLMPNRILQELVTINPGNVNNIINDIVFKIKVINLISVPIRV